MYFNYQNLNDSPKKYLSNARFWLGRNFQINAEWSIPSNSYSISLDINGYGETAIGGHFSCGLFAIYINIQNRFLYNTFSHITKRSDQKYTNGRSIGLRISESTVWINLWSDPMEHRSSDPKWWHFNIDFGQLLKGKRVYSESILEERDIVVPMPEKSYPAKAKKVLRTWSYPRWFKKEFLGVEIDIPGGIPFEGKGESAWNCGPDATRSMSTPAKTIAEAVGILIGSVLEDRVKNGGWSDWSWNK